VLQNEIRQNHSGHLPSFSEIMKSLYISVFWSFLTRAVLADTTRFDLDLTWEVEAPDEFERWMVLVNKQFPGPTINIKRGDCVEITVHNHLPFGTTIHSHRIQ
jgi:FtsP/CotA-like multicopper oxidase with cupredoxin domain